MIYDIFHTRFGDMMVCATEQVIRGLYFVGQKYEGKIQSDWNLQPKHALLLELKAQFKAYEKQAIKGFDLPLDPQGTDFQKRVWQALLAIPLSTTTTYGRIAAQASSKTAVRAAGSAIGHNPISVIIPCHRVIGSTGELTGYAGGLARKVALLAHEGAVLSKQGALPLQKDCLKQDLFA